ncbi:MAG: NapC/NirT family cytochrome c [Chloroflexi bacterium]|nr:NapC/NirT family cytochrome c [Chloroflexota bacterium]
MTRIRGSWHRLRAITGRQWAFGGITAVVLLLALAGTLYGWEYTNSPAFCGTTCHTMPPEYNAWQRSPHARVSCVECHLGRDIITTTFTRKAGDIMHLIRYSSGQFKFPVHADSMLPARESCEKCHWPEKFSGDRAVTVKRYDSDEKNAQIATYLLLKTGGGTMREGRGLGIHWHIENQVYFVATDELKQNIPWVQVVDPNGKTTTYVDVENPLPADQVNRLEKRRMDCIDCHNRISHTFRSPTQAIDNALALKQIDETIPFIKKKSVEVLSASYSNFADANKAIERLEGFYQQNYAEYYKSRTAQIKSAIDFLKTTYQSLVFPTQDLSWTTHPDNIGHKDYPGCFRCHDGKHLTQDNKEAIRLECNICHTLPEVATASSPAPVISLIKTDEPESHKQTTWLAQHRTVFDSTCQACHDTNNAGGQDNTSFCSNSACHGTEWRFAGLNAVGLAKVFPPPVSRPGDPNVTPKTIPHPIGGNPDCQICHAQASKVRPYPADHIGRKNEVCLACHKPAIPAPSTTPTAGTTAAGAPPPVTHDTAGRTQCLGCHGTGAAGVPQVPQFHKDANLGNDKCLACHKSGVAAQPTTVPTSAPTTTAPATGGPKRIPASHAGRTGCVVCHAQGIAGAPKSPPNHAGRTDETCKACHQGP